MRTIKTFFMSEIHTRSSKHPVSEIHTFNKR